MAEYSRIARGHFVSSGNAQVVQLPFVPGSVEIWNDTIYHAPANHGIPQAYWDVSMGQGFADCLLFNSTPVLTTGQVQVNGISTFQAGQLLQYGPVNQHGGSPVSEFSMTAANPIVVTTVGNHGLATGDVVIFQNLTQSAGAGMQQIAGIPFAVTVTGATTFSINWDGSGSNYTAFNTSTSTSNVGSFKKVLYPYLYFPGVNFISYITTGSATTVKTAGAHQFQVGQEVAFRIPSAWGTIQLNSLPNAVIPGSPIYGYVQSVTDFQTFVVNINSVGYTAFNVNQPFASYPGEKFPQVVAVGDVNSGGVPYSGGALYPSPQWSYASFNDSSTINGPALIGSYVNNTSQGFIVGAGATTADPSSKLVGAAENVIRWRAMLYDYVI